MKETILKIATLLTNNTLNQLQKQGVGYNFSWQFLGASNTAQTAKNNQHQYHNQ